jgi:16S rRNA (guanine966-N2)-methyltransferase
MRVIAGTARGRRLQAPEGRDTRPTGDRVREAVFNALASLDALDDVTVLDLFAGSGALGIEALSRGAGDTTFVERDAERFLDRARAEGRRWDLALLDPPYAYGAWVELLTDLPADLAVVESDRAVDPPLGWGVVRQRRYGSTLVTVLRSIPSTGPTTGPAPPE